MSLNLDEKSSPGWCAIDSRLAEAYPAANAVHFANPAPFPIGAYNPLNAVSAYHVSLAPTISTSSNSKTSPVSPSNKQKIDDTLFSKHWHFVTYGFSELFLKSPTNAADESGYGLELTFRIAENETKRKRASSTWRPENTKPLLEASASPMIEQCPVWVVEFLQGLARYVFATDTKFDVGHYMALNGVLQFGADENASNNIVAVLFVEDPFLGTIMTKNGKVRFLQVVGITQDEYELIWQSSGIYVSELLQLSNPLFLTRLRRSSILSNTTTLAQAHRYIEANGSSLTSIYNRQIAWRFANLATLDPSLLPSTDELSSFSAVTTSKTSTPANDKVSSLLEIFIGAHIVSQFLAILQRRIPYKRTFTCIGTSPESPCAIIFHPTTEEESSSSTPTSPPKSKRPKRITTKSSSTAIRWEISATDPAVININLSNNHVHDILGALVATQGQYRVGPLIFSVIPTFIRDANTSEALRVIGQ
jgi:hypothetical protein